MCTSKGKCQQPYLAIIFVIASEYLHGSAIAIFQYCLHVYFWYFRPFYLGMHKKIKDEQRLQPTEES